LGINLKSNINTMYAIVDIAGQQFKVEKDQKVYVHRLAGEEGTKVEFDKVLLVDNGEAVSVGAPTVDGGKITAKILSHVKGDKVIVFKKKRRKGYQKSNGHRQEFSQIVIEGIEASGIKAAKKATKKAEIAEE
jgi:large subunit ribosomal protein L21